MDVFMNVISLSKVYNMYDSCLELLGVELNMKNVVSITIFSLIFNNW